ncbi:MAG: hypothetical protein JSV49_10660 [Thermoplasmata archaeon]|nr:MAG: hypothetical protein JSV49_10660 [Thermoplasmata archaeon]
MNVGITERIKSKFREQSLTVGRRIDLYLTKNMPDLILKYDLATKKDLIEIDRQIEGYESTLDNLDRWRDDTRDRMKKAADRVGRLEMKYGVSKGGK